MSERLKRFAETQNNTTPEDAPWEKQAAQKKKERREARKRSAAEKQNAKAKMEEFLKALDALTKATPMEDPPKQEPPADPTKQQPMEGVETADKRKRDNEAAGPAGKAAKGGAAASAGAKSRRTPALTNDMRSLSTTCLIDTTKTRSAAVPANVCWP